MDRDVIEVGIQLARARGAELHVVSSWQASDAGMVQRRTPATEYREYLRSWEREASDGLRAFLAPYALELEQRHVHLVSGVPAEAVSTTANRLRAELIIVGSTGRSGIRRWLLGNTAEEVLSTAVTGVVGVRAGTAFRAAANDEAAAAGAAE